MLAGNKAQREEEGGRKEDGVYFISAALIKYKEHVAKVGHLHIPQPYQHHRKKPFFFPRISDLEYL